MFRHGIRFISFIGTVIILIAALKLLDLIPAVIEKGSMRRYDTIEDVGTRLKIRDIYTPSYFPRSLKWPPDQILAQSVPFIEIIMEFRSAETDDVGLIVRQTDSEGFSTDVKLKIARVNENVVYPLKGRNASLVVGLCSDGERCGKLYWKEGRYLLDVVSKSSPFELIKIAESMLH